MPSVSVTTKASADLPVDSLVVGIVSGEGGVDLATGHDLPHKAVVHLTAVLEDLEATAAPGEVHRVVAVPGVKATSVTVVGLGASAEVGGDTLRSGAASAMRALRGKRAVALALPAPDAASVGAVADGAWSGCYRYEKTTSAPRAPRPGRAAARSSSGGAKGPRIMIVSGAGAGRAVKAAVTRAEVVGAARDWARDLVNTPPNLLYPQSFVDAVKARATASAAKVTVSVLDEKALAKGGFGGITGVGQGSERPPRIATFSYSPSGATTHVALVGKGITFDSGGLNIKTSAGMVTMKSDMAGAAAVAAAVLAAAELELPVAVTGYLCLAENMPSGTAQRPGDVVVMRNGTSVEILDPDAEGRMVLGDGICLAAEQEPDWIVDIATLTGAQVVALGGDICAVMSNDDEFRARVLDAAGTAGEPAWPMPLPKALRAKLDSPVADLAHKGDRDGGMLTAGLFLQEFVPEGTPWAHLDIAGPSFRTKEAQGTTPKGGTGFGVSTLVALIEAEAATRG